MEVNDMSGVREIKVLNDDDGQRLDRWIKRHAPDIPYVLAQKLIRKGQIRIDGKRAKTDTRLVSGDTVRLPPVVIDSGIVRKPKAHVSDQDAAFIQSLVVYDDGDVIAINKPPGLAVQGGTNIKRHVDGMLGALENREGVKPRLVHRLDKDTSGVMLLARSAAVAKALGAQFKGRDIRKIYWAITAGVPDPHEGAIKAPLAKGGGAGQERMFVDDQDGKFAHTEYKVIERALGEAAFVAFWPRTGRTHQIRVHASDVLDRPILGDGKYGSEDAFVDGLDHKRMLHLHARRIILPHPTQKKRTIDVTAPLSPELVTAWKALGFNHKSKDDPFADMD